MNYLNIPTYNPVPLLDLVAERTGAKNDAALAKELSLLPPAISKIRNKKIPVGPGLLCTVSEMFDIPTKELKTLIGVSS